MELPPLPPRFVAALAATLGPAGQHVALRAGGEGSGEGERALPAAAAASALRVGRREERAMNVSMLEARYSQCAAGIVDLLRGVSRWLTVTVVPAMRSTCLTHALLELATWKRGLFVRLKVYTKK